MFLGQEILYRKFSTIPQPFFGPSGSSADLVSVESLPPNARLEICFILPRSLAILAKEIRVYPD